MDINCYSLISYISDESIEIYKHMNVVNTTELGNVIVQFVDMTLQGEI